MLVGEIQMWPMEAQRACVVETFPTIISREVRWPPFPCKLGEKYFVRESGICFKLFYIDTIIEILFIKPPWKRKQFTTFMLRQMMSYRLREDPF